MKSKYPKQHIVVSNKTLRALKKIKREKGFSNADKVINYLLENQPYITLSAEDIEKFKLFGSIEPILTKEGGAK